MEEGASFPETRGASRGRAWDAGRARMALIEPAERDLEDRMEDRGD